MSTRVELEYHEHVIREAIEHLDELPDHLRAGMQNYLRDGITPGGFMCAVLNNDLCTAVQNCDEWELGSLRALFEYLYTYAPAAAWGSPEKRQAWQAEISALTLQVLEGGSP